MKRGEWIAGNEKGRQMGGLAAFGKRNVGGEIAFIPLFSGYQVQRENLPNLFGGFGVEGVCFVGALRWFFAQRLDRFLSRLLSETVAAFVRGCECGDIR